MFPPFRLSAFPSFPPFRPSVLPSFRPSAFRPSDYGFLPGSHSGLNLEFASHSIGFTIERMAAVM